MLQGLTLFVATCAIGVGGYVAAGWSLLDATYMVIITIFGVSYREVRPVDEDGLRLFTSRRAVSPPSCRWIPRTSS